MAEESDEEQEPISTAERTEEPTWSSKRLNIAYQEARTVLEAQQATALEEERVVSSVEPAITSG